MIYVGAGRSRTSSLGGSKNTLLYSSNADNEGKGIDVDEFKSLYNNDNPLYEKDEFKTPYGELDEDLLKELKDLGVDVKYKVGMKESTYDWDYLYQEFKISDEDKKEFKKEFSEYISILKKNNVTSVSLLGETNKKDYEKFLNMEIIGDYGARKLSNLDAYIIKNNLIEGKQKISWGYTEEDAGFYNNAALYKVIKLVKIAKKQDIKLEYVNFSFSADELRNTRKGVSGFYRLKTNGINLLDNTIPIYTSSNNNNYNMGSGILGNVAVHEFGHFVEDVYNRRTGKDLSTTIMSKLKAPKAVSEYGNTNPAEAFAEAFTAYCLGVTKPNQGKSYYRSFKSEMKKAGLQEFEGCLREV